MSDFSGKSSFSPVSDVPVLRSRSNGRRASVLAAAASIFALGAAYAEERTPARETLEVPSEQAVLDDAEAQLRASFTNFVFDDFRPGPIPGLFSASTNGRIVYYWPGPPERLIFGQIFDTAGTDLTARELQERSRDRVADLELGVAIDVGPSSEGPLLYEFTNPDCGFCRSLDSFLRGRSAEGLSFQRRVIFTTRNDRSRAKAIHVLCADDKAEAFKSIYASGAPLDLNWCEEGEAALTEHLTVSSRAGVSGTPTLLVDGKLITGFRQGEIEAFLQSQAGRPMAVGSRNPGEDG